MSIARRAAGLIIGLMVGGAHGDVPGSECRLALLGGEHGYGYSLSISEDILALLGDSTKIPAANSVYMFERVGVSWTLQGEIGPRGQSTGDGFASTVAMDGDRIVAGSPYAPAKGIYSGKAHIFESLPTGLAEWVLLPESINSYDYFGYSVSIDGDAAVIGAKGVLGDRGAAFVYRFDGANWNLEAQLDPSTVIGYPQFGYAVGISGDVIVVGAYTDDAKGSDSGAAYIFERSPLGVWKEKAKVVGSGIDGHDFFGQSVAVSGGTVLVGAPGEGSFDFPGGAYVFDRLPTGEWVETAKLGQPTGGLGFKVAIDGDIAAAVALSDSTFFEYGQGAVYVHVRDQGRWQQVAKLFPDPPRQRDNFGWALAVNGNLLAAATFNNDASKPPQPDYVSIFAIGPDLNGNGTMDPCECPGDINKDWIVDQADLGILLGTWGCVSTNDPPCKADLDGDGKVGQGDLGILLSSYGAVCPP